jgi:hypothetical protein
MFYFRKQNWHQARKDDIYEHKLIIDSINESNLNNLLFLPSKKKITNLLLL